MSETDLQDRAAVACTHCETVYVVRRSPDGGVNSEAVPARCVDCGEAAFRTLGTDGGGGRSYSAP